MANKGVSSYEHMMGTERRAHEGSQSQSHSASGGTAPGPGSEMAPSSTHNYSAGGMKEGPPHNGSSVSGAGRHDLGM